MRTLYHERKTGSASRRTAGVTPTDGALDAPADAAPDVDADTHMGLRLPRCEDTDPMPTTPLPHVRASEA